MKKLSLILMALVGPLGLVAETWTDPETGYTWKYSIVDGMAQIYGGYNGGDLAVSPEPRGVLAIPQMLGEKPVTIGDYAFYGCDGLTEIVIPNSVKCIGKQAFYSCSGLTRVSIPNGVTRVEDNAFSYCRGLKSISIPDSITNIGKRAFSYTGLTNVSISSAMTTIGYGVFSDCKSLMNLTIPDGVTNIGEYAFAGCGSLTNVIIGNGVKTIDGYAFMNCKSLGSVTMSGNVMNIGDSAFSGCMELTSVTVPQFVCLSTMKTLFPSYQAITNLIVLDGVTKIGAECFSGCMSLQAVTLPRSVMSIREKAFEDCLNLRMVHFLGDAPDAEENIFQGTPRTLVVQVEDGSLGWSGGVSTALSPSWCDRAIVYADGTGGGATGQAGPIQPVVTNFIYTTVTNEVHHYSTITNYTFSTVTNEVFHYSTVTNEIFHYTTVTNVVKYVPEPGASPDAGYGITVGAGGETVIAGAAGWDAFGVPDGMEWDKETGTLSGRAKLSGAYDLILVSGSGADTKIMRTTLTVAPYDTIIGYVGVAFSQSGAPLDNLKSYKTLPAGLKWVSGGRGATALPGDDGGVLSGVPTKAQTLELETVDGEPVKIEIKALPDSVVGTFDGCVYLPPSNPTNGVANMCDILGTITLSVTAAGKLSASVKTAKKTYSFSMASWAKFVEGEAFTLEASAELKTGETLQVNASMRDGATVVLAKLLGGEFGGRGATALPEESDDAGCVTVLARDVYAKSGSKWIDEDAHALMAKCAGTYQFGFDAMENETAWTLRPVVKAETSFLKVVLKDTGVATITGTLPDKTKINLSAKASASAVEGTDAVQIMIVSAAFSGKTVTLPVEVNLMSNGSFVDGRDNCGVIYSVTR